MKTQLVFAFLLFLLKHKVTYATVWTETYTDNGYLQGFNLGTSKTETIFSCLTKCEDNIHCASINIILMDKTCELKYSTKTEHPKKVTSRPNTIYMEIRDALGSTPHNPIQSCKWFKDLDSQAMSGVYWMNFNNPSSAAFQVFCEMTIDGGGWTLVYSYTFTQFNAFTSSANAVTPIPNWPISWSPSGWVPQSTITPLSESSHTAMDFALWKKIGKEVLLKPNITNWIACVEGTGSLVNWITGSLSCRIVKANTPICTTDVPNRFRAFAFGPGLYVNSLNKLFLCLDGKTGTDWPTHDPCGGNNANNHLTNVPSPGGALYLR